MNGNLKPNHINRINRSSNKNLENAGGDLEKRKSSRAARLLLSASNNTSSAQPSPSQPVPVGGAGNTHDIVPIIINPIQKQSNKKVKVRFEKCAPCIYKGGMVPTNATEAKDRFLKCGIDPVFQLKGNEVEVEKLINHNAAKIHFQLFNEAKRIIESICKKYKKVDVFINKMYGPRISLESAVSKVNEYIAKHKLEKDLEVIWCTELACSAQMNSIGPEARLNKPEERKYILLIKSSSENCFIREKGIDCLMDHEIGTHFFRSYNDGYQVWYSDREKFKLTNPRTYEGMKTEEGFACLNTLLNANKKSLCMPALLYYSSCLAEYMSFRELFDHLRLFVESDEQRWKHCMRVKRGLKDVNQVGGYGKDQRYFEGAVEILRNLNSIDLKVLMSGKILWTDTNRLSSIARREIVRLPHFMQDMDSYIKQLREIAILNNIEILSTEEVSKKVLNRADQVTAIRQMTLNPFKKQLRKKAIVPVKKNAKSPAICGCDLFTKLVEIDKFDDNVSSVEEKANKTMPIVLELNMLQPIGMTPF